MVDDGKRGGMQQHGESGSQLLPPWLLALITFAAGTAAGGIVCASVIATLGKKRCAAVIFAGGVLLALAVFAALLFWPMKWFWSGLILLAVHIISAVVVFAGMQHLHTRMPEQYRTSFSVNRRREKTYILAGIFGGLLLSAVLGPGCLGLYLLGADSLFNTLIPVAFDNYSTFFSLAGSLLLLLFSGAVCGGILGRQAQRLSPLQAVGYLLLLVLLIISWYFLLQLFVLVPSFQASTAGGGKTGMLQLISVVVALWWIPLLCLYCLGQPSWKGKMLRFVQAVAVNLCAVLSLSIFMGVSTNWFNCSGKLFEQRGYVERALWCYRQGLEKQPSERIAGYLQYRVALLAHKLGDNAAAMKGFQTVVSLYGQNGATRSLAKRASRYLDYLKVADSSQKRVVLPGVDTPVTYKSAYCAPNSLALVFHYWGADFSAQEIGHSITGLARGTSFIDQAWYAYEHDFRTSFFPMSSLEDIKKLIDAGMPVLVYVPGHVFAVVGYDEQLRTLVTYDVATQDVWVEYFEEDFVKAWKKSFAVLAAVYPEKEASRLPKELLARRDAATQAYMDYSLSYYNGPDGFWGKEQLERAVAEYPAFFIPQLILSAEYPQNSSSALPDTEQQNLVAAITNYFSRGFDEATHLWGQYSSNKTSSDRNFQQSLLALVQLGHLETARQLIDQVEVQGPISTKTKEFRALLDIAQGDVRQGAMRLEEDGQKNTTLYLALAEQALGRSQKAVTPLVGTVSSAISCDNCRTARRSFKGPYESSSSLSMVSRWRPEWLGKYNDQPLLQSPDSFGNPEIAFANDQLLESSEYGDSFKKIEDTWGQWSRYNPFDYRVAGRLAMLTEGRLTEPGQDRKVLNELQRRLHLLQTRAAAYKALMTN